MHSALSTNDILTLILEALAGGDTQGPFHPVPQRQKSLLYMGLACKSLLEPALDVLWASVKSLAPLCLILPTVNNDHNGTINFALPEESHRSRLLHYSNRIRYLTLTSLSLSHTACAQISLLIDGPLLPKLRGFHCHIHSSTTLSELALVLGSPNINIFKISSASNGSTSGSLQRLAEQCMMFLGHRHSCHVEVMEIALPITRPSALNRFTSFTSFEMTHPIPLTHVQIIGQMPSLRTLRITLDTSLDTTSSLRTGSSGAFFPALERVDMMGPGPVIYAILSKVNSTILAINISGEGQDTDVWNRLIYIIHRKWSGKLRYLRLIPGGSTTPLPPNILNVSLEFSLETLFLQGWKGISCTELSQLALSFRNLKSLHINSAREGGISWKTLQVVNGSLPMLTKLNIWFNTATLFPDMSVAPGINIAHPLKRLTLNFHTKPIYTTVDQLAISAYLDRLFPSIQTLSPVDYDFIPGLRAAIKMLKQTRMEAYQICKCDEGKRLSKGLELAIAHAGGQ